MIYFPKTEFKILVIVLVGLITLNACYLSTKSYTVNIGSLQLTNISELQYENCLSTIPVLSKKVEFINNTKTFYFGSFSKNSILFIYLGYFILALFLILFVKVTPNNSTNDI
jgi:hypothetical protein